MGKKGMITSDDMKSLHSRYHIPDSIELFSPREGETLRDHRDSSICLNEWMFRVGVQIPFKFGISELFHIFGAAPIQVFPNSWRIIQSVMWSCEWRKCRANRHLWASLLSRKGAAPNWGVPSQWSDGLPEVRSVVLEELEMRKRMQLLLRGVYVWRGVRFFGRCPTFDWGVVNIGPFMSQPSNACGGDSEEKEAFGQRAGGVTTLDEEEKRLTRQEKADLHVELTLSRKEARCSGFIVDSHKTSMGLAPSGLAPLSMPGVDVEGDITSPVLTFEREPFEA
ncbi:hypothetical protein ACLOJK_037555 [Asimina triloba]